VQDEVLVANHQRFCDTYEILNLVLLFDVILLLFYQNDLLGGHDKLLLLVGEEVTLWPDL